MSTLAEIEVAVSKLPIRQQEKLLCSLAGKLGRTAKAPARPTQQFDAKDYPALEGLPPNLSIGTKEQVRALLRKRHAADC